MLINPEYYSQAEEGSKLLSSKLRDEKFYAFYKEDIIELHRQLYRVVQKAQDLAMWPEFSVKKIKLLDGETLTDLLLANAVALALEYNQLTKTDVFSKAIEYYNELASKRISLASPFFNKLRKGGGNLSSCFIMEVGDSLESIMKHLTYCARISKGGGGVGCYLGKIRGKGASIGASKNAASSVMAWVRLFDQICVSVNQLGARPGAITVALPLWHIDIQEFLDCQTENGDLRSKAYNIQPQVCVDNVFMTAVEKGSSYNLYCPKDLADNSIDPSKDKNWRVKAEGLHKKSINARALWKEIQERQRVVGRPYLFFTDNAQNNSPFKAYGNINSANLCCGTGDTLLLTSDGYERLDSLEGQEKPVWNGEVFSNSKIFKTSESSDIYRVHFTDCSYVDVTDYHRWFTLASPNSRCKEEIKITAELKPGTVIPKVEFPVIKGTDELKDAYSNGFYSGDGHTARGHAYVDIVGEKLNLVPLLNAKRIGNWEGYTPVNNRPIHRYKFTGLMQDKFFVPSARHTIESRLSWFAGLLDADGCVAKSTTGNLSLQLISINKTFIDELRLMLNTLGIDSSCGYFSEDRPWPFKSIGTFKPAWRISINTSALNKLIDLGLCCYRLKFKKQQSQRNATEFKKVVKVEKLQDKQPTWCLIEPLKHKVIFNGTVSSQCFTGNTKILTELGEIPIASLAGSLEHPEFHKVWNGMNYSNAPVYKVADNQIIYRVHFTQGHYVDVTEDHNWWIATPQSEVKDRPSLFNCLAKFATKDLQKGMQLPLVFMPGNFPFTKGYLQKAKNYVSNVEKLEGTQSVYCLTEPLRNMVIANGVPTGQCESYSYFEVDKYIHCCNLISINLGEHESLASISASTTIATEMVDLSLNLSTIDIPEAQKHVKDFRTVGIGMMGLADWLAKNQSYYSDLDLIEKTQKVITLSAYRRSIELAQMWGSCEEYNHLNSELWEKLDQEPDSKHWVEMRNKTGIRNAMLLATAPNTSTSLVMGATASFLPPYETDFIDESETALRVVTKYAPHLYLTNQQIPQEFITDATAAMQRWVDAGISMEYLLPEGASWSTNKAFSQNKISAWKQGVKAVYYTRTTEVGDVGGCSSGACSN